MTEPADPSAATPAADRSLPLLAVDVSILPLLRETWGKAIPKHVRLNPSDGAISIACASEWTISAQTELREVLNQLLGQSVSLRLSTGAKSAARAALHIKYRNAARPDVSETGVVKVTNAADTPARFPPATEFHDITLTIDQGVTLNKLTLQIRCSRNAAAKQPGSPASRSVVAAAPGASARSETARHEIVSAEGRRDIDSYALSLADFASRIAQIDGVTADLPADLLTTDRERHEYVWLTDIPGFREALNANRGHLVQMSLEGVVLGRPNIEAFLGLDYDGTWKNTGARPGYPVAVRLDENFKEARVGLRIVGHGSLSGLKIGFKSQRELEVHSRIALRRMASDGAQIGRLKMALIADPFTVENFEGIVDKILIKPHDWRSLLKLDPPDFLFVESAWVGNDNAWANRIANNTEELAALAGWCRSAGIPTIFWNKEDPVHFHRFLKAAALFDLVYTTSAESVPAYEEAGVRARVLPFSVNLATFNPIGSGQRRGRYGIFAGAYYGAKYPERTADMEQMLDLTLRYGLRIFDRYAGSTGEEFAFPKRFHPFIAGSANARQLDREYKRARLAINVNSVKGSRSMFARRVVELAATGTPILSNASPALDEMFAEGLVASDDAAVVGREIERLFEDDEHWMRRRRMLMRTALLQHTVQDRLAVILRDLGVPSPPVGDGVAVLADNERAVRLAPAQFPHVHVLAQTEVDTPLWRLMPAHASYAALALNEARWDDGGLSEFLRHQDYARADVLGEANGSEPFRFGGALHDSLLLVGRQALIDSDVSLADLKAGDASRRFHDLGLKTFGVERLTDPSTPSMSFGAVATDRSRPLFGWWTESPGLSLQETPAGDVEGSHARETHAYVRVGDRHRLDQAPETCLLSAREFPDGFAVKFDFRPMEGVLAANLHVYFYRNEERLEQRLAAPNARSFVRAPRGWTQAAIAVRLKGEGRFAFRVEIEEALRTASEFVNQALGPRVASEQAWLCVSSVYPRRANLYRNAFVHTRVKGYLAANKNVVVVSMEGATSVLSTYEFEGVRVFAGAGAALADVLRARAWDRIACHIVSAEMFRVLDEHAAGVRKVVWIHAIEAERWHRRSFDVDIGAPALEQRLRALMAESDERNGAVRRVYERSGRGLADCRVVFVSHWFRRFIGCVDVRPEPQDWRVIHNPIDPDLFVFRQKQPEDRFRWMSVRPFVSPKYGNDMTVAAILLLSQEPWFDRVSVTLFGRGVLFEETVRPLRRFANVRLEETFLTQAQIAEQHARHGIFIGPTRSDSQGVSLDEAMSSGLVPVSNDCQAICEFVPPEWGLLAAPDDAAGLADCIRRLVENPDRFCELSALVSRHIQAKCGSAKILQQEIAALTED